MKKMIPLLISLLFAISPLYYAYPYQSYPPYAPPPPPPYGFNLNYSNPAPYPYPYPNSYQSPTNSYQNPNLYKTRNVANSSQPVDIPAITGQDLVIGARSPNDQLLLHSIIYKRPGFWSNKAEKEISYPPPGSKICSNITQVIAHDNAKPGTGAFVKVIRGGIGKSNITLLFKSQKGEPIDYKLFIFGQKANCFKY